MSILIKYGLRDSKVEDEMNPGVGAIDGGELRTKN
jgi:hypothetical protein